MKQIIFSTNENERAPETTELVNSLVAFNRTVVGPSNHRPFVISVKDESGKLMGAVDGYTHWGWLFISHLWVNESVNGQKLGTRLMEKAEELARARGCKNAWLDTFSFQARPFYEKIGYEEFAKLDDYPPGFSRHFMQKKL